MPPAEITVRMIRAFLAAAAEGSMSGAAGRLGCSQPAVSRNIARLELILATRLFERRHVRGVGLTEAGQELLPDAATMVAAHDRIASRRTGGRGRSFRR